MKRNLIAISIIYLLFSCKPTTKIKTDLPENNMPVISFTKGQCKGLCSKYNIYVFESKMAIQYEGIENVERYGLFERSLTRAEYTTLISAYENAGFINFKDQYSVDITDFPMITMTYNNGKINKKIEGRTERPQELITLQRHLERLVSIGEWKTLKTYPIIETNDVSNKLHTKGDVIENQIIIKIKPNVSLSSWIRNQQKYGVNLMNKLTSEGDTWLISYDLSKIKAENMIVFLRSESIIESAEFNKIVSPREH